MARSTGTGGGPETEFVASGDGSRIAFDRRGSGPVLVLVDGALSERRTGPMRPLAEHLASSFTVVTYDRRGRGESSDATGPVRGYRVDRELDDLRCVVAQVQDPLCELVALHGGSTGGLLALHAAGAGLPVRSVSLFEPSFGACGGLGGTFADELARLFETGRRVEVVTAFQRAAGVPEPVVAAGGAALFARCAQTVVYDCVLSAATTPAVAQRVRVPVQVVTAAATGGRVPRRGDDVLEALPRAERVALPAAWHGVPDEVLAPALKSFHRRRPGWQSSAHARCLR